MWGSAADQVAITDLDHRRSLRLQQSCGSAAPSKARAALPAEPVRQCLYVARTNGGCGLPRRRLRNTLAPHLAGQQTTPGGWMAGGIARIATILRWHSGCRGDGRASPAWFRRSPRTGRLGERVQLADARLGGTGPGVATDDVVVVAGAWGIETARPIARHPR